MSDMTVQDKIYEIAQIYREKYPDDPTSSKVHLTREDFMASFALANANSQCLQTVGNAFGKQCIEDTHNEYESDPDAFIARHLHKDSQVMVAYPSYRAYQDMADAMFRVALRFIGSTETYHVHSRFEEEMRKVRIKYDFHLSPPSAEVYNYMDQSASLYVDSCKGIVFGRNMADDRKCFGFTLLDVLYR